MGSTGGVSLRNTESLTGLEVLLAQIYKRNTDQVRSFRDYAIQSAGVIRNTGILGF